MVGAHPFRIGKSPIHGRGVFAARPIPKGELIGVAILRIGRGKPDKALRQTILSRYLNHANEPNAAMVPIHGGFGLLALGDIPEDKEIVVDYDRTGRTVEPEPFPAYQDFDPDPIKADPRIRTLGRAGSFKIIEVDGPAIRDSLDADFPGLGHHSSFPFIPTGEFWIDREAVPEGLSLFEGQLSRRAGTLRLEPSTRGWERYREPFWFAPPQKEPPPGFQPELSYPGDPDEGGFRWADVGTEKTPGAFVLGQPLARWLFGKLNSRGWTVPGLILDMDKGIFPSLLDPHGRPVRIGKFLSSLRKKLPSGSRDAALADEVLHQYEVQPKETEWRLIVSAEPVDLRGISTGRGWSSCMALKPGERKECLESSIGARDMVAYAVDRNGQWLARSVLRFDGKGHWWPEKAYGQPSSIRLDLFLDKVRQWLKERDLLGKEGEFSPFFQGPSDWRTQNRGPRAERTVERPEESMEFPERYRGTGHSLKPETMAKWPRRVRIVVDDVVFELPGEFGKPQDVGRTLRDIGVWLQDPKAPGRAKFLDIDEEGPAVLAEVWDNQGLRRIKSHPLVEAIIDEDTNMALALCAFPLSKRAKMSRLERREVTRWIEENVSDPKNHCFFYAAVLAALFPGLTLVRGWNTGQFRDGRLVEQGDTGHFWLEDEEGDIIDPTAAQYPGGRNFGGSPVSLAANLPEAIEDPLFKTLPSGDQEKILQVSADPVSGRHIGFRRHSSAEDEEEERLFDEYWDRLDRQMREEEAKRPKRRRSEMTLDEIEFLAEMDPEEREEFLKNFLPDDEPPPLSRRAARKPDECPLCGLPAQTRCRCRMAESTCPNGHKWHTCPIHGTPVLGHGGNLGRCSCGLRRPSNPAKDHSYVAKRKEESGNFTYVYDEKHVAARNRKKEKRLKKLSKSLKEMRAKVRGDLSSDDETRRLAALAVALIDETYERVGNEESASELKHYGVTGWLVRHVTLGKGKATIKYVGKAGVKQTKEVKNKAVLKALRRACEGKKKGDRVLEGISAKDVNAYLAPFRITAKDIRGYHANKEMLRALKTNGKPPKGDGKAAKERFKKALEDAAKKVGHEPGTLKRQYLIPRIEQYYMEGKSVGNILASARIPLSKRAALMDIPPKMVEDTSTWVRQAHANLCLALYRPPPPEGQVEAELAALKGLEAEARRDAKALLAGSWDDTAKAEEAMLPRWDGRKLWLRLSATDGPAKGILFIARRTQPGHWAYGINVQGWRRSPPQVPGMAPGSGYALSTVLSKLAERINELTEFHRLPRAEDYRRHEELETAMRKAAAGAPPFDIAEMDASYSQEKELPVDISGWKYERLAAPNLPWNRYIVEVAPQAPRDAAAAYHAHVSARGRVPEQPARIVVYAGRLLRPFSAKIFGMEQENLTQSVRHEMVHLAQDLLKGALRLRMLAGLPPMGVREPGLDPSGFARPSQRRLRRQRKLWPESTFTGYREDALRIKHQLRDVEFQSNLRDSIEEWRRQAAQMDSAQRLQFLRFWVKGDHTGYYDQGGVPTAVFAGSDVFRTLYNEARHDRTKRDRWAAAVRIMSKEVADMLYPGKGQ